MTSPGNGNDRDAFAPAPRLESWKEIAGYLRRDVRTAIRWERDRALPVHRVPGGRRQAVFAYPAELDAWLSGEAAAAPAPIPVPGPDPTPDVQSPAAPSPNVSPSASRSRQVRWMIAAATLALAVAGAAWMSQRGSAAIASVRLEGAELVASDAAGRERWRHALDAGSAYTRIEYRVVAFSGTSAPDVVVGLTGQTVPAPHSDRLLAFSADGRLKWSIEPDDSLKFGAGTYAAPWFSSVWTVLNVDGEVRIHWAVRHVTWWPSMLLTYDGAGRRLGTFVNAGWIHSIDALDDRTILVGGVSNSANAGMVAVIDPKQPSGSSPEAPDSEYFCASCPNASPVRYLTFGRSEINRTGGFDINMAQVRPWDRAVEIRTLEAVGTSAEAVYQFSTDLAINRARFGDRYWDLHRRLENEGRIRHSADTCPERALMPPVHVWTQASGWTRVRLPAQVETAANER